MELECTLKEEESCTLEGEETFNTVSEEQTSLNISRSDPEPASSKECEM